MTCSIGIIGGVAWYIGFATLAGSLIGAGVVILCFRQAVNDLLGKSPRS